MLPKNNELFFDIDDLDGIITYDAMREVLRLNNIPYEETLRTRSKGGNTHIYGRLGKALSPVERIAFQAAMGSDRKRELLSLLRAWLALDRPPTTFFETLETTLATKS